MTANNQRELFLWPTSSGNTVDGGREWKRYEGANGHVVRYRDLANGVCEIDLEGGRVKARRELEGAYELIECPLPAVVTIDEGIARPRYPSLKGIMAAKKKPLEVKPAAVGAERYKLDKMELPPERAGGRIIGEGKDAVPELVRLLKEEAKVL